MAESTFEAEIITPNRVRYQGSVAALTLPGSEGEMGILPHHAPLLALLDPGVARVRIGGEDTIIATGEGFVKVSLNRAAVLVEFAEKASDIDLAATRTQLEEVEKLLAKPSSPVERAQQVQLRKACRARIRVCELSTD